jgi:menaquinone-dependent protoporphyrinogen oxidase
MKVHIVVASRHHATTEIATAIAEVFERRHLDVDMIELEKYPPTDFELAEDDAVVFGSAIYAGNWLKAARRFLDRYCDALHGHRVWLFSSGPLGDDSGSHAMDATRLAAYENDTGALGHHLFAGRLDTTELGFGERLVAAAVNAPSGDFRDWDDVDAWANEVADNLTHPAEV